MSTISNVSKPVPLTPVRWLPLIRSSVILMLAVVNIFFVLGIPYFYDHLTTLCTLPDCQPLVLTHDDVASLESVGLSASFYAITHLMIEIINVLFVNLICIFYLRRFMTHWMGYVASLTFISFMLMPNVIWSFFDANPSLYFVGETLLDISTIASFSLIYIFPTGRFIPRWSVLFLLLGFVPILGIQVSTYYQDFEGTALSGIYMSPFLISIAAGVLFQIYRYRYVYTLSERRQARWVILGFALLMLGVFGWGFFMEYLAYQPDMPRAWINLFAMPTIMVLSVIPLPVALTIAIVEEKLWNIDLIINRTVIYAVLTAVSILTYVFVVGTLNLIFHANNSLLFSVVATGIVALSFHTFRAQIQNVVNRMMFGQRDDPQAVLSQLSERLQSAILPEELLTSTVGIICNTLKLPYAAISIRRGAEIALQVEQGENRTPTQALALNYHNEEVGQLVVGRRSPNEALATADRTVLESIARQMGAVVYAVRLQSELQQARERLVIAREEERRRLRRDLHDGLGPALASQTLKLDTAIELFDTHSQDVRKLLVDVRSQSDELITDIRRIVHDLRPPALDELGLEGALENAIARMNSAGRATHIQFESALDCELVAAAVQSAAYWIILEAITNVMKHAKARKCRVKLGCVAKTRWLQISIEDDGVGLPMPISLGVGLQSMRERAEELGGQFRLEDSNLGGTRVVAQLPLAIEGQIA